MKLPVFLDHNATTPVAPEVADAIEPFLHDEFGNPSSSHVYGRQARDAVCRARAQVAALVTIMHANNEVGTLQEIAEIARRAHARGALVHTDAAQSVGNSTTEEEVRHAAQALIKGWKALAKSV